MHVRLLSCLLLLGACSGGGGGTQTPTGEPRTTEVHWDKNGMRDPVVRARFQERMAGGDWVKDGEYVAFDRRGRETHRGSYRAGIEHGPWIEVEEGTGHVGRGEYRDGKREGRWTYSFPTGATHSEGAYVGGKRTGMWNVWLPSGDLSAELMYQDGELHGPCTFYAEGGAVDGLRSGRYAEGERVGG